MNKRFIQLVAMIVMLISMVLVGIALVQVAKNNQNDMKCYWTTNGVFCISELGENNE